MTFPEEAHDSDREHVGRRIESVSQNMFVSKNAHGTQLDLIQSDTKFHASSSGAASSDDPPGLDNCEPPLVVSPVSNKRKIDDTNFQSTDPATQRRGKVNLKPGSKLALRFPQHVKHEGSTDVVNVPCPKRDMALNAPAVSNKRRRILPFSKGNTSSQCAEEGGQ